jgi:hypothetical protein
MSPLLSHPGARRQHHIPHHREGWGHGLRLRRCSIQELDSGTACGISARSTAEDSVAATPSRRWMPPRVVRPCHRGLCRTVQELDDGTRCHAAVAMGGTATGSAASTASSRRHTATWGTITGSVTSTALSRRWMAALRATPLQGARPRPLPPLPPRPEDGGVAMRAVSPRGARPMPPLLCPGGGRVHCAPHHCEGHGRGL